MLRSSFEREERAMGAALAALETAGAEGAGDAASIERHLGPLLGTPRGRFLFLEGGGVGLLLARLRTKAAASPSHLLPWCRLLSLCCRDEESAVALGLLGGHPVVKRLMDIEAALGDAGWQEVEVEAAECAAEIASRCSLVRGGFPVR
jgi:hypothetical protein